MKAVGYVLIAVSLGLATGAQFVPGGEFSGSGFGANFEINAYPWGVESSVSGIAGESGEESQDWFEAYEDDNDSEGQDELKAQMVLGYIGMGFIALGLLGAIAMSGRAGAMTIAFGFVCCLVAIILFATGIDKAFDGNMDLAAGYWMSVIGVATSLLGAAFIYRG